MEAHVVWDHEGAGSTPASSTEPAWRWPRFIQTDIRTEPEKPMVFESKRRITIPIRGCGVNGSTGDF